MRPSVLLAALCLLIGAGPARATTTGLGGAAPDGATGPACAHCSFVQVSGGSYVVPAGGGVITIWSLRGGSVVGGGARPRLRLYRPGAPSGGYTVVADSGDEQPEPNAVKGFAARIAVSGGEVIGLRLDVTGNTPSGYAGEPADMTGMSLGDPPPGGDTGGLVTASGRRLNIAVRLESDQDHDGFGDDSQDPDDDGDGLADTEEQRIGTDPRKADTDGDGFNDRVDNCRLLASPDQSDSE